MIKIIKRFPFLVLLLIVISLPILKTSYYEEGVGQQIKRVSVITIMIEDYKQGTIGTMLILK